MKNLVKVIVVVGVISLVIGAAAKLVNAPILNSKPLSIMAFADSCFLLSIALLLMEDKK